MGKIYVNDLASVLMERHQLSKAAAQRFLASLVETIQEGIASDGVVKIKGLGTFKVIDVEARESVNVNTGERVTIGSHSKLTFTPDNSMKELVNRPFAAFETVILNEGVNLDDEAALAEIVSGKKEEGREDPAPAEAQEQPVEEQPVEEQPVEEQPVEEQPVEEQPVVEEAVVEEPVQAEESVEEEPAPPVEEAPAEDRPVEEAPVAPQYVLAPAEADEDDTGEEEEKSSRWWLWLLLIVAGCALCFAGGYLYDRLNQPEKPVEIGIPVPVPEEVIKQAADSLPKADSTVVYSTAVDSVKVAAVKEEAADGEWKKYEDMDVRVRTGAYRIVGTDQVVTAREGDTSKRLARRMLGEGMECYIEVYNGISGSTPIKAGQEIKIPKLQLKKKQKNK